MDVHAIAPACSEEFITDDMLDLMSSVSYSSATGACSTRGSVYSPAMPAQQPAVFDSQNIAPMMDPVKMQRFYSADGGKTDSVIRRAARRTSVGASVLEGTMMSENLLDESADITSDDSGDFGYFTDGLDDPAAYNLVRGYMVFCKQQEQNLKEMEAECVRLEAEQKALWGNAAAITRARRNARTVVARPANAVARHRTSHSSAHDDRLLEEAEYCGTGSLSLNDGTTQARRKGMSSTTLCGACNTTDFSPMQACFDPHNPKAEYVDAVEDEFNDVAGTLGTGICSTASSCRYMDPHSPRFLADPFRFSTPAYAGAYSSVFKTGFLYRTLAEDGSTWTFFNDSEKYCMHVKYRFGATSQLQPGPMAKMTTLASGEVEVEVVVMPEESEILVTGSVNGYRNFSSALLIDESFQNVHVARRNGGITDRLEAMAKVAGKSCASELSVEEVLSACRTCKDDSCTWFIDPEFQPCSRSIFRPDLDEMFLWDLPWRRPDEYLSATGTAILVSLFRGHVLPSDPQPGDGGDAYLCSAARILAEFPMKVRQLFRHPRGAAAGNSERACGAYRVTLNHGGWWRTVLLDSYFPASKQGPEYARCEADLRKLWWPLLEKAYAKVYGSYAAIQCGDPLEALHDLTGFPTSRFDAEWQIAAGVLALPKGKDLSHTIAGKAAEELFCQLEARLAAGYVVCLSVSDEGTLSPLCGLLGLAHGMSYCVLGTQREGAHRLLHLRCSTEGLQQMSDYGQQKVPTRWCPGSPEWRAVPKLARRCNIYVPVRATSRAQSEELHEEELLRAEGVWLDWQSEALAIFWGGGVCYTRWSYSDCRVKGSFQNGLPLVALEVTVRRSVTAYCLLSQPDDRGADPNSANSRLVPLMLSVSSRNSGGSAHQEDTNASAGDGGACKSEDSFTSGGGLDSQEKESEESLYSINAVCVTHPDEPASDPHFVLGRDVAMLYTFDNVNTTYYIVARAKGHSVCKAYTLGLLTSEPVNSDALEVRFVSIAASCGVFTSQKDYSLESLVTETEASYQVRAVDGTLHSGIGSRIE